MKQPYKTALYMRLSRDDETYGDSVSIESQRIILRKYAEENGFMNCSEYIDDGWSGTNFDRPDFQRMMEDVEAGKINCIITKDLSRFGREHVMMDYYLEFIFPENHVRYIAVTENEDTDKGLSDFVPFKNLFNEWYAKDTSRKVKAALRAKHSAGQRTFSYAPLGYRKDPDNKNHIIIDEETRWIIEKIFDLAQQGAGAAKITSILITEHIPTPGSLNYQRYGTFANIYADQPEEKQWAWSTAQVKNILKDETYIGNSVHNKQSTISYKNKKIVRKPQEEWLRVENTHDAIISKAVFEQVQEQIANRRRKMSDGTTQIFAGLLKCADCGWSLNFATNKQNNKPYSYYNCKKYREFGAKLNKCSQHYIRYDVLYDFIMSRICYWTDAAAESKEQLIERIMQGSHTEAELTRKKLQDDLKRAKKRKSEVDRLFAKVYEDWASERITEYNFSMLSEKYQTEQVTLAEKVEKLSQELDAVKQSEDGAEKWVALLEQYRHPTELTAEMLNELIEKIVVHEATKTADGTREQEIEVFYRFVGKIE